jgi:transglutaminase-like putative cysteine protease
MKIHQVIATTLLLRCAAFAVTDMIPGEDQFEFIYRFTLPKIEARAQVWLPLAKTDVFQTVTIERLSVPTDWKKVEDRDYKNEILILKPGPSASEKSIEIRYRVRRIEKGSYGVSGDAKRFLHPERLVPINETFKSIATEVTTGKADDMERGRALYEHVLGRMKYDKSGIGWGRGDAVYACNFRTGNCSDFHSYFIALLRSIGIPARFAIGFTIPADKDEGKIAGYHCWAEFSNGEKWVPVDISEASKNPKLSNYYFGHNPANRFEISQGRDLVTDPPPESGPINFLVFPLIEIDGKIVKAETEFAYRRAQN